MENEQLKKEVARLTKDCGGARKQAKGVTTPF
jgi:hypothetical protein